MRFFRYSIFLCIAVISGTLNAQSQRELGQLMRDRGEYYFTLSVNDPSEIQAISTMCSIDGTDGRTVIAYANQKEYDRLLEAGYEPDLQTPPSLRANVTMWDGQGTYNWDSYLTYPQYVTMMEEFPSKAISGRTCTLFSLGTLSTSNHRQLLGVRINNGSPEGKPKFLYTSTMHGDEITGMILMLRLINELCTSTDSQIVNLVNNLDIYIMPLTNPDGTYKGGNNTVNSAQRYNGNNIDLNRNYKDYYEGVHPDGNGYEDETVWTMAFGDENLFTMSANYHGGAEVMNYPWDATYDNHADMSWYEHVCTEYVQVARQTYSSYMSDTYSDGVTSGAAWYVITGSRQDYMNAYAQCREVTIECSTTKTPTANQLPNFWSYNRNSMLAFMGQSLNGVHGFVYDAVTNQPIEGVKVTVENHDSETSFVTTHSVGDFHRPIKGGTYTFTFTKQGYYPESVQVTVADDQRVERNNILLNPITWTITATANPTDGGTVNGAGNYATGETCTLTATAAEDYQFIHWTENGTVVSSDANYSFQVSADRNLVAVFASTDPINITISANPTRAGLVNGGGNYLYGQTCTVTATPNEGYSFINWTENGAVVSENSEYSFMVSDERDLVANFTYTASLSGSCYYPVSTVSANSFVMGYLNGTTLAVPTHNNNSTVSTTSVTIIPTDDGFSVETGTTIPQVTLTAYGNNGQYYISYNGRYLARSSYGSSLTWGTSTSQYGRWYINSNGIYVTRNTNTYYLYYDTSSKSFKLSTTQQNNINFYVQGDCPVVPSYTIAATANPNGGGIIEGADVYFQGETCTLTATANQGYTFINWTKNGNEVSTDASYSFTVTEAATYVANFEEVITTVTQTCAFTSGCNWWTAYVDVTLAELEAALGANGITITAQDGKYVSYHPTYGWGGDLTAIEAGKMYKIQVTSNCTVNLEGEALDPATHSITLAPGTNWIGYFGAQAMSVGNALVNLQATAGDVITAQNGDYATYNATYGWGGNLNTLEPGKAYTYSSKASSNKTFTFPNSK